MQNRKDDFAWLVRSLDGRRKGDLRAKSRFEGRFETVDEIIERRMHRRDKRARVLMLLVEMLPVVLMLLVVLIH